MTEPRPALAEQAEEPRGDRTWSSHGPELAVAGAAPASPRRRGHRPTTPTAGPAPARSVPPTQVAEWAGHSVRVLLTVYAKCVVGEEQRALRLIDASFAAEQEPDASRGAPATSQGVSPAEIHGKSTDGRTPPAAAGLNQTLSVTEPGPATRLPDDGLGL